MMEERRMSYTENLDLWFLRLELEGTRNIIIHLIDEGHIFSNKKGTEKFIEVFNILTEKFDAFYNLMKINAMEILEPTENVIDYDINFITREFKAVELDYNFDLKQEALKFIGFNEDYQKIAELILAGKDVL